MDICIREIVISGAIVAIIASLWARQGGESEIQGSLVGGAVCGVIMGFPAVFLGQWGAMVIGLIVSLGLGAVIGNWGSRMGARAGASFAGFAVGAALAVGLVLMLDSQAGGIPGPVKEMTVIPARLVGLGLSALDWGCD